MNLLPVFILVGVILIIWLVRTIKTGKAEILSGEKKEKERLDTEKMRSRFAEKDMLEQKEASKHRVQVYEEERKASADRKFKEEELRRKIADRKKREAGEEK